MTTANAVREVPLPVESCIADSFKSSHFADAFAIYLPPGSTLDIDAISHGVLGAPALWFRVLIRCRDAMVKPFGVKTSAQIRDEVATSSADRIDFFPVLARSTNELIVGESDIHLDFKTSILRRRSALANRDEVVATTVVHCHNRLGRFYIATIAPFHRLVIRYHLAQAAARF